MATISDLSSRVTSKLGSRTDITTNAYQWLYDAILELSANYEIEELEETGPTVALTASTRSYPIANLVSNVAPVPVVQTIVDLRVYTDRPTNTILQPLRQVHIQEIDKLSPSTEGLPTMWARWGANIEIAPTPDAAYSVILRYRKRHPLDSTIQNTTVLLTPEWEHIVVLLATAYGHDELKEHDRAQAIYTHLYGGRDSATGVDKPGLIAKRLTKREREFGQVEVPMRVLIRPSVMR